MRIPCLFDKQRRTPALLACRRQDYQVRCSCRSALDIANQVRLVSPSINRSG
jgi:hypothetical protein